MQWESQSWCDLLCRVVALLRKKELAWTGKLLKPFETTTAIKAEIVECGRCETVCAYHCNEIKFSSPAPLNSFVHLEIIDWRGCKVSTCWYRKKKLHHPSLDTNNVRRNNKATSAKIHTIHCWTARLNLEKQTSAHRTVTTMDEPKNINEVSSIWQKLRLGPSS